eukprot:c22737_g1_i1 orf=113-1573(-)
MLFLAMVVVVVVLLIVAAAAVCWRAESLSLLRSCRMQGIPGFSVHWASQPDERDGEWSWNLLNKIKQHGKLFYFKFGKTVRLFVVDPILIQQILINNADCYAKSSSILMIQIMGNGLFTASGEAWYHQRQLFGPAFYSKELKAHFEIIKKYTVDELENWDANLHSKSQIFDIHKGFLILMVKMISHIAFGAHIEHADASVICKSFDHCLHNYRKLLYSPFANIPGYRVLTPHGKEIAKDTERLLNVAEDFTKSRVHSCHANSPTLLIDMMLKELTRKDPILSTNQVQDNCLTFLLAGHETTASLLTWTIYLLALHPIWQERARAEVANVFQGHELSWMVLNHLKTVNMILFESLRLFPPQAVIGRTCVKENMVGNYSIPMKLEVVIPIAVLHRDEDLWGKDAEDFQPDRFTNGISGACRHPLSFLPFGSGPRTCIGQALALLESRIVLALMLLRYRWKLSPCYQHCPDVTLTLQPKFGMPIILENL